MALSSSCVSTDGVRIAYTDQGSGKFGFGLVHAWACDRSTMSGLADHLAGRGRVVNVELRGHGKSDKPLGPYRADDFFADVAAAVQAAGITRLVLVGHSLGGRVALGLAERQPALVAGVVILDSTVIKTADYARAESRQQDASDWPASLAARIDRMFISTDRSKTFVTELMTRTPKEAATASLAASAEINPAKALQEFAGPVLYVGASSPREDRADLQALHSGLFYGQVVESGHFIQLEVPAQVQAMIDRFCDVHRFG